MKLIALCGGGDWWDASLDLMAVPEGLDIEQEKIAWRAWYKNEYGPRLLDRPQPEYVSFPKWLESKGARDATKDEIEEVWEP